MFSSKIQERAHNGNREAFREIFNEYSREVYAYIHTALADEQQTKDSVKQVFLGLFRELMKAEKDIDLAERLTELTNEEIKIARMAGGNLSPIKEECAVSGGKDAVAEDVEDEDDIFDEEDLDDEDEDEDDDLPEKKKKGNVGTTIAVIFLVLLILIFLWLVAGILMDYGIIPTIDLGYSWFNAHVFDLFRLPQAV